MTTSGASHLLGGHASDPLASALAAYRRGDLAGARNACRQALDRNPKRATAWHLSGVVDMQDGLLEQALAAFDAAVAIQPLNADAHANRGLVLHYLGRNPEAVRSFNTALQVSPASAQSHNNRGMAFAALGDLDAAGADYHKAINLEPRYALAYYNLGVLLLTKRNFCAALVNLDESLALSPDFAPAYTNRGLALHALKRYREAISSYEKAISIQPADALAYNNRGLALQELREFSAAIDDYRHAILLAPRLSQAHSNLGTALKSMHRFEEALAAYEASLAVSPDDAQVVCNRGAVLQALQRVDEAQACFERAVALDSDLAQAHCHHAYIALLRGNWKQGWQSYEWRAHSPHSGIAKRNFLAPRWTGAMPLAGKTLLIHAEQGLGDSLQFCRFIPWLADRGARVIFEVQSPLRALVQNLPGVSMVLVPGDALPPFDFHCPLMSLPLELEVTEYDLLSRNSPYLHADADKAAQWKRKFGSSPRPRLGLVWSGGFRPDQPELWSTHERRNVSFEQISTLNTPEIDFVSLQKGEPAETQLLDERERYWPEANFFNWVSGLNDFSDTAALITNLDGVISVDTSTAHLAAAMGKPVWMLNRFDTCWRWQLNRMDSPWYPSLTLYRQQRPGDWSKPLEQIREQIQNWFPQ